MKPTELSLMKISYNQGTQFRKDGDPKVQEEYAALMQEGVVFPPVEVVFDGDHYYLWDGFTRYFAAAEIGAKTIVCNITKGSLRDAQILACSANKTNGQPRSNHTKRGIIEFMLEDEDWGKKTQEEIASHVGVTRGYVARIAGDIRRHEESDNVTSNDISTKNSTSSKAKSKPAVSAQKQSKSAPKSKKNILDAKKKPVPEHLVPVFEGANSIKGYIGELVDLHNRINRSMKTDPLLWYFVSPSSLEAHIANVKRQLEATVPYAVCAYCGGNQSETCQACNGVGFLNQLRWNTVPEELR